MKPLQTSKLLFFFLCLSLFSVETKAQITWPANQLLPSFPASAPTQDLIYTRNISAEEKYLFSSLDGLVNLTQPRIFVYDGDAFAEGPYTWLQSLGLNWVEHSDNWELLTKYRNEISGLIVYDPAQIHTVNLATALAKDKKALIASPALLSRLSAAPYNLPVLLDLRGQFTSKLHVYQTLFDTYWPTMDHRLLIGLNPEVHQGSLREYATAVGTAVVWLDPQIAGESELLNSFLASMSAGARYMGWWPDEGPGITRASGYGISTIASDFCSNLTVHSGMPRTIQIKPIPPKPKLQNKIYVAFIISDGDNLQYVEHLMRKLWNNPDRGSVPIGWTLSPAMVDAMPGALNYYHQSSTENDNLISGPSGYGYTYPNEWTDQAMLSQFVTKTEEYNQRAGFRVITVWNGITGGINQNVGEIYAASAPSLLGVTAQNTGGPLSIYNNSLPGKPLSCNYCTGEQAMKEHIASASVGWNGAEPRFVIIQAQPWTDVKPSNFKNVMNSLNSNYTVVRPDHLFQLLRESKGMTIDPLGEPVSTVYTDCGYAGNAATLPVDNYTTAKLQARGITGQEISSLKLTQGYEMEVFDGDNFTGNSALVKSDSSCLTTWNNRIKSLKLHALTGKENGLVGNYFNGQGFETFVSTRIDPLISFNWGEGSPMSGIGNDDYSIRWTGFIQPRYSEKYTFYLTSDNGRRLWINDQLVIDKWIDDWDIPYSGEIELEAGKKYSIRIEYFEKNGGANCKLEWTSASQSREIVPSSQLFPRLEPVVDGDGDGLTGNYFNGENFETFVSTRVDPLISFNWGEGSPMSGIGNDDYSIRWTGFIQPRYSEKYTFYLTSDNGRRLWINDQLVIDKWISDWDIPYSGTIELEAGKKYTIKIEYFEHNGGANCNFEWTSASQPREVVPIGQLYSQARGVPPVITHGQVFSVEENAATHHVIGKILAADPDADTLFQNWEIIGGTGIDAFELNRTTGELSVKDSSQLDFESSSNAFSLLVTVQDDYYLTSAPDTILIKVTNQNDLSPVVKDASFIVSEKAIDNQLVGTASATDADDISQPGFTTFQHWTVTGGTGANVFWIDSVTGKISVHNHTLLDFETTSTYTLLVTVSDGMHISAAKTLNVALSNANDNTPVVTEGQHLTLSESAKKGDSAGKIVATDADDTNQPGFTTFQKWQITGGNGAGMVDINETTGEVTVKTTHGLDFERATSYSLKVRVGDGTTQSSSKVVTLAITNDNDNAPQVKPFQHIYLTTWAATGDKIGMVAATDPDDKNQAGFTTFRNWQLTGIYDKWFAIDSATGEVRIADSKKLNLAGGLTCIVQVTVSDGKWTSEKGFVAIHISPKVSICYQQHTLSVDRVFVPFYLMYGAQANACTESNNTASSSRAATLTDTENGSIVLYPNPTSKVLYLTNLPKSSEIEVYALTGQRMIKTSGTSVNVETLVPGVYLLKINSKEKVQTYRFVKQ